MWGCRQSDGLCASVLAPDMKHKNGSNEEQWHDEDGHRSNFDARWVVGVEAPHASGSGTACVATASGRWGGSGGLPLFHIAGTAGTRTWHCHLWGWTTSAPHVGCASWGSGLKWEMSLDKTFYRSLRLILKYVLKAAKLKINLPREVIKPWRKVNSN